MVGGVDGVGGLSLGFRGLALAVCRGLAVASSLVFENDIGERRMCGGV